MLQAVLFDLDGTLLEIELEPFLREYFDLLGPVLAGLLQGPAQVGTLLDAVMAATRDMGGRHPGATNKEVFDARFLELTGLDLRVDGHSAVIKRFYLDDFPALGAGRSARPGAGRALEAVDSLGLKRALATNPIFPRAAIDERARWAGIDSGSFDLVTSYEMMTACKPSPEYFLEIAGMLDVEPSECLMVGDDPVLDLAASDVGMATYYVGTAPGTADYRGTLDEFADSLPRIAGLSF